MSTLDAEFAALDADVRALIALLLEAEEAFWAGALSRSLEHIEAHRLAGATRVLGCYGGADTFSDLVIGRQWSVDDPLRFRNLNARLGQLRTKAFESANVIASRRSW
jgi:hypothetical protein